MNVNLQQLIIIILSSSSVAALVTKIFDFFSEKRKSEEERRQKLYGSLIFNLMLMDIITSNQQDLMEEIKSDLNDPEIRINAYRKDVRPLVVRWISCKDNIKKLFENYPGYIKKDDILLVRDFLDGCIKRDITENGKNRWTNEERTEKLLSAIKALQDRLLDRTK